MKMNVIWIILSIILIFFWGQASYGESILVVGTPELLIPLTYTHYLDGHPAIFFSEQQEGKALEKLLSYVSNIIFFNNSPLDLALQILEPDYGVKISDSKKPIVFESGEDGVYGVWRKQVVGSGLQATEVRIDGKEVIQDTGYRIQDRGMKWEKIGRIELKKGRHRVAVEEAPQELIIAPERTVIQTGERIRNYLEKAEIPATYFFSKELSSTIDSWEERSLKGSFYIPTSRKYALRAKVSPQYVKAPDYGLKKRMGRNVGEWSSTSKNVKYFTSTRKNILIVSTYLDGGAQEKESLYLKRKIKLVDLEKYPNFEINYLLKNPKIQKIEVILGIDLNNDGKVDIRISEELPSVLETYSFNLCKKVRDSLGQDLPPDASFHLLKVYLKVSKKDSLDCSTSPNKGWYKASFKDFGLYGFSEDKCVKSRDYVFNERLGLTKELKGGKGKVVLNRSFKGLDFEKYPFVNLIHQSEDPRSLLVNTVLYLDHDNDGKVDGKVIQEGITPANYSFNALELVKSEFPSKKHYYLTKLIVKIFRNPEIVTAKAQKETEKRKEKQGCESVFLQHLQIYNEKIMPYEKVRLISPVLKIDRRKLSLTKSGFWYTTPPAYLKAGYHNLDAIFPGLETKLDFIAIGGREWSRIEEKRESTRIKGTESKVGPEIMFQKINPTKYLVKVEEAKGPFWLVFSESFHKKWQIYQEIEDRGEKLEGRRKKVEGGGEETSFDEIVADYPNLGVKEARHLMKFTPSDIKYLFRKPLTENHYLVNGYANGWYIEPKELGLGENFVLVIYFWPQSLFYLGLGISGLIFLGCIGYLAGTGIRRK